MSNQKKNELVAASFRDPSGFLFWKDGVLYRQINAGYKDDYDFLIESGLYRQLLNEKMLLSHEEELSIVWDPKLAYKVIKPEILSFVSYPYEWSFSQLKDAALLTLQIQKKALSCKMTLKDASAYNIQFYKGKPILIDTLSFEKYEEGKPWIAYRQFCQHFLAPLALMSARDVRLVQLLRNHVDGIPLDLATLLLPFKTRLSFGLLSHIHLHAKSQKYFSDKSTELKRYKISSRSLLGLIDSLESTIKKLKWAPEKTEWAEYYQDTNYGKRAFEEKKRLVAEFVDGVKPETVWDLGSNTGIFSRIASSRGIETVSFDIDPAAVEKNYEEVVEKGETHILPLLLDLTNPSPGIGWQNQERESIIERGPVDMVFALALIHHLAISNNLPFANIAQFFSRLCTWFIVEFVPKTDSNAQRLLRTREDIFPNYTQDNFEREFKKYFDIQSSKKISGSERILYLMKKQEAPI